MNDDDDDIIRSGVLGNGVTEASMLLVIFDRGTFLKELVAELIVPGNKENLSLD